MFSCDTFLLRLNEEVLVDKQKEISSSNHSCKSSSYSIDSNPGQLTKEKRHISQWSERRLFHISMDEREKKTCFVCIVHNAIDSEFDQCTTHFTLSLIHTHTHTHTVDLYHFNYMACHAFHTYHASLWFQITSFSFNCYLYVSPHWKATIDGRLPLLNYSALTVRQLFCVLVCLCAI